MPELSVWGVRFTYSISQEKHRNESMMIVAKTLEDALSLVKLYYPNPLIHNISHHGKVGLMDYEATTDFNHNQNQLV